MAIHDSVTIWELRPAVNQKSPSCIPGSLFSSDSGESNNPRLFPAHVRTWLGLFDTVNTGIVPRPMRGQDTGSCNDHKSSSRSDR